MKPGLPSTNPRLPIRPRLLALAILFCCAAAHGQQRYWYDGDQRRALWAEGSVVADFAARSAEKSRVLKPAALVKGASASESPVFRDAKASGSATRALPGGVIVRFRPSMPEEQRRQLIATHRLEPVRELGEGSGLWLMHGAPGLASLDLANRLYESGDFAAASPNWWQPRRLK